MPISLSRSNGYRKIIKSVCTCDSHSILLLIALFVFTHIYCTCVGVFGRTSMNLVFIDLNLSTYILSKVIFNFVDLSKPSAVATPKFFVHKQTEIALKDKKAIIPGTDLVSYTYTIVHSNPLHIVRV